MEVVCLMVVSIMIVATLEKLFMHITRQIPPCQEMADKMQVRLCQDTKFVFGKCSDHNVFTICDKSLIVSAGTLINFPANAKFSIRNPNTNLNDDQIKITANMANTISYNYSVPKNTLYFISPECEPRNTKIKRDIMFVAGQCCIEVWLPKGMRFNIDSLTNKNNTGPSFILDNETKATIIA